MATVEMLRRRAALLARLRRFFLSRDFWEVETPLISAEAIPELNIELRRVVDSSEVYRQWLQASPEMAMKCLMAEGCDAIFQVARSFRGYERGQRHRPEFTLVEWYRRGDDLQTGMDLLADLASEMLSAERVERVRYGDAFREHVGIDPHRADCAALADRADVLGVPVPEGLRQDDRDDWLTLLLSFCVEPRLGQQRPVILYEYPAVQAALAKTAHDADGNAVALRFELYAQGVELANGYDELTDADELRHRLESVNAVRAAEGRAILPLPERMLDKMCDPGLPACAGCALGFDRLAMLALGASSIHDVMA